MVWAQARGRLSSWRPLSFVLPEKEAALLGRGLAHKVEDSWQDGMTAMRTF